MKCILGRVTVVASLFTEDHFFPSPFLHFPPLILRTVTVSIFIVCAYRCSIGNCHLVILVSVNVGNLGNLTYPQGHLLFQRWRHRMGGRTCFTYTIATTASSLPLPPLLLTREAQLAFFLVPSIYCP